MQDRVELNRKVSDNKEKGAFMKNFFVFAVVLCTSLTAFAESSPVKESEIKSVEKIVSHFNIPHVKAGDCKKIIFDVKSLVRGFNPASWTAAWGTSNKPLPQPLIGSMINITNRLPIKLQKPDSITLLSEMKFIGKSCNNKPMVWNVSYKKKDKEDKNQNNSERDPSKDIIVPSSDAPASAAPESTEE